jgi:hypothetical protein
LFRRPKLILSCGAEGKEGRNEYDTETTAIQKDQKI